GERRPPRGHSAARFGQATWEAAELGLQLRNGKPTCGRNGVHRLRCRPPDRLRSSSKVREVTWSNFIRLHQALSRLRRGRLILGNPSPQVVEVLDVTRLNTLFEVCQA